MPRKDDLCECEDKTCFMARNDIMRKDLDHGPMRSGVFGGTGGNLVL